MQTLPAFMQGYIFSIFFYYSLNLLGNCIKRGSLSLKFDNSRKESTENYTSFIWLIHFCWVERGVGSRMVSPENRYSICVLSVEESSSHASSALSPARATPLPILSQLQTQHSDLKKCILLLSCTMLDYDLLKPSCDMYVFRFKMSITLSKGSLLSVLTSR